MNNKSSMKLSEYYKKRFSKTASLSLFECYLFNITRSDLEKNGIDFYEIDTQLGQTLQKEKTLRDLNKVALLIIATQEKRFKDFLYDPLKDKNLYFNSEEERQIYLKKCSKKKAKAKKKIRKAALCWFKTEGNRSHFLLSKVDTSREKEVRQLLPKEYYKTNDFLKSYQWRTLRAAVLSKSDKRCFICGSSPQNNPLIFLCVDHIKPRKHFPELALTESNLQILCNECNHGKGNRLDI